MFIVLYTSDQLIMEAIVYSWKKCAISGEVSLSVFVELNWSSSSFLILFLNRGLIQGMVKM